MSTIAFTFFLSCGRDRERNVPGLVGYVVTHDNINQVDSFARRNNGNTRYGMLHAQLLKYSVDSACADPGAIIAGELPCLLSVWFGVIHVLFLLPVVV